MRRLGFERFHVAGHDRGGRVAYRMAPEFADIVSKLSVMDIVPSSEAFARGQSLPCGHYLPEELPHETTRELLGFLSEGCAHPQSPFKGKAWKNGGHHVSSEHP